MNGVSYHRDPMYEANGAPPAAAPPAARHPGRADAPPPLRRGTTRRRRRDRDAPAAPSSGFAAPSPPAGRRRDDDDASSLLARRVEELARLNDEYRRIVRAEIAAREMRDRVVAASEEAARGREREAARTTGDREAFWDALRQQQAIRRREANEASGGAERPMGNAPTGDPSGGAFGRGAWSEKFGERPGGAFGECRFFDGSGDSSFSNLSHASSRAFRNALCLRFLDGAASPRLTEEMALRMRLQRRMMEEEAVSNQQHQQRQMHQAALTLTGQQNAMGPSSGEIKQPTGHGNEEQLVRLLRLKKVSDQEQAAMICRRQHRHQQATMGRARGRGESRPSITDKREHGSLGEFQGEQTTGHDNWEHFDRLLELRRMSDDDLLWRAAEVRNDHGAALAPRSTPERDDDEGAAVARQLAMMEYRLVHGGLPGGISRFQGATRADQECRWGPGATDQVQAHEAATSGFSDGSEMRSSVDQASSIQRQLRNSTSPDGASAPLRYFDNGIEVDADGNPLPAKSAHAADPGPTPRPSRTSPTQRQHSTSPRDNFNSLRYFNNGTEVDADGRPMPTENGRPMLTENGHAPAPSPTDAGDAPSPSAGQLPSQCNEVIAEITPVLAHLLPDGGDLAMLKSAFPNVVDAALAELRSVRERLAGAGDNSGFDLIRRAMDCIPSTQPVMPPGAPPFVVMSSGMTRPEAPPEPGIDPVTCRPLVSDNQTRFNHDEPTAARQAQGAMAVRRAHQHQVTMVHQAQRAQMLEPDAAKEAKFANPADKKDTEANTESRAVSDDLPLMAAYKAKKRKQAKKRKRNRKPKIAREREAAPIEERETRRDGAAAEEGSSPRSKPARRRRIPGRAWSDRDADGEPPC